MPKSRNRSRDQKKRAQKKRNDKARLARRHAEMIADRQLTAQLYDESEQLANCNQNKVNENES